MKRLVYCIFRRDSNTCPPEPGTCYIASDNGLAAVVSRTEAAGSHPDVSSLLEFGKVVGAMHSRQDVIPLRYGCVTESNTATLRLLQAHRAKYEILLARMQGMAEMGIRLLCPAGLGLIPGLPPQSPGARYLASLRSRGSAARALFPEEIQLSDSIAGLLAGCYTARRAESAPAAGGRRLLSLYFLTPKSDTPLFRSKARAISLPGIGIMLSGPWPPYNFVAYDE